MHWSESHTLTPQNLTVKSDPAKARMACDIRSKILVYVPHSLRFRSLLQCQSLLATPDVAAGRMQQNQCGTFDQAEQNADEQGKVYSTSRGLVRCSEDGQKAGCPADNIAYSKSFGICDSTFG